MTKKIASALFIATAIQSIVFAEENKNSNDTLNKETIRKNEIAIGILPLTTWLSGADLENPSFSATYRRNFNDHWSGRISPSFTPKNTNSYYQNSYGPIYQYDTSRVRETSYRSNSPSYKLNLGIEYNLGKRKLKWYAGADLFIGYSEHNMVRGMETWVFDTASTPPTYVLTNYFLSYEGRLKQTSIGIAPFVGVKYPLTKRFSLSVQSRFDANMTWTKTRYAAVSNPPYYDSRIYELNMKSIINDISLIYRF